MMQEYEEVELFVSQITRSYNNYQYVLNWLNNVDGGQHLYLYLSYNLVYECIPSSPNEAWRMVDGGNVEKSHTNSKQCSQYVEQ